MAMHFYEDLSMVSDDDSDKAMSYAQKALDLGCAIFGKEHPLTGRPYHYVGVIYELKGEWENALYYFRQANRIWLPAYGINHEMMVSSNNKMGNALKQLGRYDEALACFKRSLSIQNVISDRLVFDHAKHHLNIAKVLVLLGRVEEAYGECQAARSILDDKNMPDEPRNKELKKALEEFVGTLPR